MNEVTSRQNPDPVVRYTYRNFGWHPILWAGGYLVLVLTVWGLLEFGAHVCRALALWLADLSSGSKIIGLLEGANAALLGLKEPVFALVYLFPLFMIAGVLYWLFPPQTWGLIAKHGVRNPASKAALMIARDQPFLAFTPALDPRGDVYHPGLRRIVWHSETEIDLVYLALPKDVPLPGQGTTLSDYQEAAAKKVKDAWALVEVGIAPVKAGKKPNFKVYVLRARVVDLSEDTRTFGVES